MSWHYSRALVEAYSEANCSGTALSALSKTMPTHGMFWSPGKTTEACPRSRSGIMYAPLKETLGAELLTWFQEDSRVRTFPQPERAPESPENGQGFGAKWHELSVKYDLATHSWKTVHCLFPEDLPQSLVTLPKWGTLQLGGLWERITPAHLTSETESGFWQTPTVSVAEHPGQVKHKKGQQLRLPQQVKNPPMFPTPSASEPELERRANTANTYVTNTGTVRNQNADGSSSNLGLAGSVKMFPTPTASTGGPEPEGKTGRKLATAVKSWPTPAACMSKGSSPAALTRKTGKSRENDRLDHKIMATEGGQLNPDWVELLMGWPRGWTRTPGKKNGKQERRESQQESQTEPTDYAASATDKCRKL